MVRLVATDLDGTFLAAHADVSDVNARALHVAREAGVPVVFATGRPTRWMEFLKPYAVDQPLAIVSNGAAILDMAADEYLEVFPIDHDLARDVVADLRAAFPTCAFSAENGHELAREERFETSYPAYTSVVAPDEIVGAEPLLKLVVQQLGTTQEEFVAAVEPVLAGRLTATFSFTPDRGQLELSAAGVSKAHALAALCARMGVDAADVAAFGDMPNDLAMLQWVGHPHLMPHAHPDLLATGFPVLEVDAVEAVGTKIIELLGQA